MDVMLEWYELNGQNVDEASIEHQTLERPFFTYEDFNSIDTTASFRNMAEFYASIGNITDEDLEKYLQIWMIRLLKKHCKNMKPHICRRQIVIKAG